MRRKMLSHAVRLLVASGVLAGVAVAEDLTSESFILRGGTFSGGGGIDLQSTAPNPTVSAVGATIGQSSPIGVSSSPSYTLEAGVWPIFASLPSEPMDTDGDGVPDSDDNCLDIENPDQIDSNLDGYGNVCDGDFNNDGGIGIPDFNVLRGIFGLREGDPGFDPDVDMNSDNGIGIPDFAAFRALFGGPPGPSGLDCAGTIPCPEP